MPDQIKTAAAIPDSSPAPPGVGERSLNSATLTAAGVAEPRADTSGLQAQWVWYALGGITVLAALLRAYRLDHGGLWYDELIMARITSGTWSSMWTEISLGRPPIYPTLGMLWAECFGQSDTAIRSLSAVMGVITVPLLFLVGRRLFDWRVGLLSALLLSVSPYQVYYSQEHRYYALFLMLCLASIWLLLRALGVGDRREEGPIEAAGLSPRPRSWSWAGYVLTSVLAFYTHSFALFLLPSIGAAVLAMYGWGGLNMARTKAFLISQTAIIGLILPWGLLKMGLVQQKAQGIVHESGALVMPMISSPPWWAPVRTLANFLFLGFRYLSQPWTLVGLGILLVGLAVAVKRVGGPMRWAGEVYRMARAEWSQQRGAWWIVVAWTAGPLLLVFILSYTIRPIYNDRYLIASTAGLYLIVSAAIISLMRLIPAWAMLGVIMLGMVGSLSNYYEEPNKGAWAEAAAWLDDNWVEGEALAFSSERDVGRENANVRANWFWYADSGYDQEHLEINMRSGFDEVIGDLKAVSKPHAGVWLVMWRDPDDPLGLEYTFDDGPVNGLILTEVKKFFDLTLLRFERIDGPIELADSEDRLSEPIDTGVKP